MPFTPITGDSQELPKIQLEEVDSKNFKVLQGFRYVHEDSGVRITVEEGEGTDLASIPFFLRWFVGTYGKHTRAAIAHDHMWRKPTEGVERRHPDGTWRPDTSGIDKIESNKLFRDAMADMPRPMVVVPVKRWAMWAAVTLDTLRTRMPDGPPIYAFVVLHLVLDVLLVLAAVGADWFVVDGREVLGVPFFVALLVFPAPLALLWPRMIGAGLIATYTLLVLVVPIVVTLLALGVFLVASGVYAVVQKARRAFGADVGPALGPSLGYVRSALLAVPVEAQPAGQEPYA